MSEDLRLYYEGYDERGRLGRSDGRVEFARTCEVALRALPPPPAVVADIGGGPGAYATWLADLGYSVVLRDVMPHHVAQAKEATRGLDVECGVADARHLDLADASVDAVLLLGPLYHLPVRENRVAALREAARVVRPGGTVLAAAINRWTPLLDGALVQRVGDRFPGFLDLLERVAVDGVGPPLFPGDFTGFFHSPDELRAEVPTSFAPRSAMPGSNWSTSSASKASASPSATSTNAGPTRQSALCFWKLRAAPSACPS